jgi:hypothetical protein
MRLALPAKPASADVAPATAWPKAALDDEAFRVGGRLGGGFELAPVNLELMAEAEREATLENLGALYDAIPGPFQLVSVPTGRSPVEHLDALRLTVDAQGERVFRPYAANYHEISTAPSRPPRRTVLLVDAAAEPELARTLDLVRRVAEERDFGVRRLDLAAIAALWGAVARVGARTGFMPATRRGRISSRLYMSADAGLRKSRRVGSRVCSRSTASRQPRCASDHSIAPRR